jgi:hypothetical protein
MRRIDEDVNEVVIAGIITMSEAYLGDEGIYLQLTEVNYGVIFLKEHAVFDY